MTPKEDIEPLVFSFDGKFGSCMMQLWKVFYSKSDQWLFQDCHPGGINLLKVVEAIPQLFFQLLPLSLHSQWSAKMLVLELQAGRSA